MLLAKLVFSRCMGLLRLTAFRMGPNLAESGVLRSTCTLDCFWIVFASKVLSQMLTGDVAIHGQCFSHWATTAPWTLVYIQHSSVLTPGNLTSWLEGLLPFSC